MRRLAQFLLMFTSAVWLAASSAAQTVNISYDFSGPQLEDANVSEVDVLQIPTNAVLSGKLVSQYFPKFTRANTPTLTNGVFSLTNVIKGLVYRTTFFYRGGAQTYDIFADTNAADGATIGAWTNVVSPTNQSLIGLFTGYMPKTPGATVGQVWTATDNNGNGSWQDSQGGAGGTGTVTGPNSSSVDNLAAWNSLDGSILKDSGIPLGNIVLLAWMQATNTAFQSYLQSSNSAYQAQLQATNAAVQSFLQTSNAAIQAQLQTTNAAVQSQIQSSNTFYITALNWLSNNINAAKIFGIISPSNLGSGTPSVGNFLRGDGTWTAVPGGGDVIAANHLSEYTAAAAASRANIGAAASSTTVTIAGTSGQINSSTSTAQPLSANVTTTISLPNAMVTPGTLNVSGDQTNQGAVSVTGGQTNFGSLRVLGSQVNQSTFSVNGVQTNLSDVYLKSHLPPAGQTNVVVQLDNGQFSTNDFRNFPQTNQLIRAINLANVPGYASLDSVTNLFPTIDGSLWTLLNASSLSSGIIPFGRFGISAPSSGATNFMMLRSDGSYDVVDYGSLISSVVSLIPASGGGSPSISSNILVQTTNEIVWPLDKIQHLTLQLNTNLFRLTLTNTWGIANWSSGLVQLDTWEDTNGTWKILSTNVVGGLMRTYGGWIRGTNASQYDTASMKLDGTPTNVIAKWDTNAQPVISFTNTLTAGGGGGGGGDTAFVTAVNSLDGAFAVAQETGMAVTIGGANITVTQLGRYVHSGDGENLPINLYDSSGTLLRTVNTDTTGQTTGTFVYGSITSVTLTAGQTYYILVAFDGVTDKWSNNGTSITTTGVATPADGDRIAGSVATHAGQCTGPVNFMYH